MGRLVPVWSVVVLSPEGSDGASSVNLEVLSSAGSPAELPAESEVGPFMESEDFSAVEAKSLDGSEDIFLRQDA